jgi:hypothetical protein
MLVGGVARGVRGWAIVSVLVADAAGRAVLIVVGDWRGRHARPRIS